MTVEHIVLVQLLCVYATLSLSSSVSFGDYKHYKPSTIGVTQSLTRLSRSGTLCMHTLPDPHFDNLYATAVSVNELT